MKDRIGINVFKCIVAERGFVVLDHGVVEQERMSRGTDVVLESLQRKLRRLHAASNNGASFQEQAAITGFRQVRSSNHAVVSRASYHDVEAIILGSLLADGKRRDRKRRECCRLHKPAPADFAHARASSKRSPTLSSSQLLRCWSQNLSPFQPPLFSLALRSPFPLT